MPISSIANVNVSLQGSPLATAGFGIPIAFIELTGPQDAAWTAEYGAGSKVIELTAGNYLAILAGLGITSSDAAFALLQDAFSQGATTNGRTPSLVLLARKGTWAAQADVITVANAAAGDYTVSLTTALQSDSVTFAATGETATQIRDALKALLDAITLPITFADSSTDAITATADNAGVPFIVTVSGPSAGDLTVANTTPNTGIFDGLVAADAERSDWYWVLKDDRNDAVSLYLAEVVEGYTRPLMAAVQTDDAAVQQAGSADIASILVSAEIARTSLWWHNVGAQGIEFAISGKQLPKTPGSTNWANQDLASVVGIDPNNGLTSELQLLAKRANYLERFAAKGTQITRQGITPSGLFIDLVRGRDYLVDRVQTAFLQLLRDNDRVPYTSDGRAQIEATLRGVLLDVAAEGLVTEDSIQIETPTVAEQGPTNRGNRHFPGIVFRATLQGAVNTFDITGFLSP